MRYAIILLLTFSLSLLIACRNASMPVDASAESLTEVENTLAQFSAVLASGDAFFTIAGGPRTDLEERS